MDPLRKLMTGTHLSTVMEGENGSGSGASGSGSGASGSGSGASGSSGDGGEGGSAFPAQRPASEGGDKGGADGGGDKGGAQNAGDKGGEGSEPPVLQVEIPEGFDIKNIPEKFRSPDGKVNVSNILKSYGDLEGRLGDFGKRVVPDSYKVEVGEIEGFDRDTMQQIRDNLKPDDPLVEFAMNFAKENKLTQEELNKMVTGYIASSVGSARQKKAEMLTELGDGNAERGQELVNKNIQFFAAHLDDDEWKTLAGMATSTENIKVLDTIRKKFLKEPDLGEGGVPSTLTEESLRAKMATDAYQNQNHPDHKRVYEEVQAGYQKLYPGKRRAG